MKRDSKTNLSEEHLRKIWHRNNYKINESPRYRSLVGSEEEFDEIPMTNEAGDQEDDPLAQEKDVVREPSNDPSVEPEQPNSEPPVPEFDDTEGDSGELPPPDLGAGMPVQQDPSQEVDTIQNDIIKHNLEAMKAIHGELEGLSSTVAALNTKMDSLNSEVEEVREPTNAEKLMSKNEVSYPYYFNLNDYWGGSWFAENREKENTNGIRELPDGSFIADFDDLPKKSKIDVQNSFNEF